MSVGRAGTTVAPGARRARVPGVRSPGLAAGFSGLAVAAALIIVAWQVWGVHSVADAIQGEDVVWFSAWLLWSPAGVLLARQPQGRRLGVWFTALSAGVLAGGVAAELARRSLSGDRAPAQDATGIALTVIARLLADLPSFALLLPLAFPDGRLPSRRWRPVLIIGLAAAGVAVLSDLVRVGPLDDDLPVANPLALSAAPGLVRAAGTGAIVVLAAVLVIGLGSLVVRRRRGDAAERAGVTAFGIGASWLLVLGLFGWVSTWIGLDLGSAGHAVMQALALLLLPGSAVAATVRRVRFGADPLLSRSLTYLLLTVVIVVLYVAVAALAGQALEGRSALGLSLIVTGLVAVALSPLKLAVQRRVEQVIMGRRSDPYAAMITLADRIAATPSPRAALQAATRTVAESLHLPYVVITAWTAQGETVINSYGEARPVTLRLELISGAEPVGTLGLAPRSARDRFGSADERLLRSFADRIADTVALVRLTEELQTSREALVRAREEERRRIRNELHDGVGPVLASAALALGRARRSFADSDPQYTALGEAAGEIRQTIADVRALVHDLRPPALDELGLVAALSQRAAGLSDPGRTVITVLADGLPALPAAVEVAAYRIVGEALTNVATHAGTGTAQVCLSVQDDRLVIIVRDDGRGVGAGTGREPVGVGTTSMRARAGELGGELTVGPRADGAAGTEVRGWLPIR